MNPPSFFFFLQEKKIGFSFIINNLNVLLTDKIYNFILLICGIICIICEFIFREFVEKKKIFLSTDVSLQEQNVYI